MANYYSTEGRARRAVRRLEALPVREASEGAMVKLVGTTAAAGPPLRAPLSGRACVGWQVTVEELCSPPSSPRRWSYLTEGREATAFLLGDETGQALVDGAMALLLFRERPVLHASPERSVELEAFAAKAGLDLGSRSGREKRFFERALEVGVRACVLGLARWEPDPRGVEGGYRETPKRLIVRAPRGGLVVVTDDPQLILADRRRGPS
jgi:hypothetical protein